MAEQAGNHTLPLPREMRDENRAFRKEMMPFIMRHLERLSETLGKLPRPVHACVAGGAAVNHHVGGRMSGTAAMTWSRRVPVPPDLKMLVIEGDDPDAPCMIAMDGGIGDVLGSFPPDREDRAARVATAGDIVIHVIDPVDLAVSRVARFQDRDIDDIRRLAAAGLVDPDVFEARIQEALEVHVGDTTFVQSNARDAAAIVRHG